MEFINSYKLASTEKDVNKQFNMLSALEAQYGDLEPQAFAQLMHAGLPQAAKFLSSGFAVEKVIFTLCPSPLCLIVDFPILISYEVIILSFLLFPNENFSKGPNLGVLMDYLSSTLFLCSRLVR